MKSAPYPTGSSVSLLIVDRLGVKREAGPAPRVRCASPIIQGGNYIVIFAVNSTGTNSIVSFAVNFADLVRGKVDESS